MDLNLGTFLRTGFGVGVGVSNGHFVTPVAPQTEKKSKKGGSRRE